MRQFRFSILALAVLPLLLFAVGCGKTTPTETSPTPAVAPPPAEGPAPREIPTSDRPLVSLYVMSECPYGVPAEAVTHKVAQVLKDLFDLRLVFIISQGSDGKIESLHGPREVEKDLVQVCAGQAAPEKQLDFIVQWNEKGKDWQATAKSLGLSVEAIEKCRTDGTAERLLREHLAETNKLNVHASPTILINGAPYAGGINSRELFEAICKAMGGKKAPVCDNPPETLSRSDGSAKGSCSGQDSAPPLPPEMVDKTPFTHTIVYDAKAIDTSRMDLILKQTLQLYPDAKVEKIDYNSAAGKKFIAKYGIKLLPAYFFPGDLAKRSNFKVIEPHVVKAGDGYLLSPRVGGNFYLDRKATPKTLDVFFTPVSQNALRSLLDLSDLLAAPEIKKLGVHVRLLPFTLIQNGEIAAQMGVMEVEEMLRVIAILNTKPDKVWDYLKGRAENPLSSYWEDFVTKAGLDPATIKKEANADKASQILAENSNLAAELSVTEEFAALADNQELIRGADKEVLRKVLLKIGK